MPSGYHQLSRDEQCQIDAFLKSRYLIWGMAKKLGCSLLTMPREIKPNKGAQG